MKNKLLCLITILIILICAICLCSCSNKQSNEVVNSSQEQSENKIIYDQEIKEEKFLKEKISSATSIYYKSSINGDYGNDNYLFEYTALPSEYTEVEYIESNGTQCIDTGIEVKESLKFDFKFSDYSSAVRTGGIFGTNGYLFSFFRSDKTQLYWVPSEKTKYIYSNFSPFKSYTISCSLDSLSVNDSSSAKQSDQNNFGNGNIYLFKYYLGGGIFKLHNFKIYDGKTIVRDFIPCYRNKDEAVGLYDLVSKTFFTDDSGSTFNYKEIEIEKIELPTEYIQLDYLEFNGNQYIDTGCLLTNNFEIEYSACADKASGNSVILGCGDVIWHGQVLMNYYQYYMEVGTNDWHNVDMYTPNQYNTYKVICNNNHQSYYRDNHLFYSENEEIPTSDKTLYIGYFNYGENARTDIGFLGKLFSFKIIIDDVLVRKYVPCMRGMNEYDLGLYDLVEGKFYTNIGTGFFSYNEEIDYSLPSEYKKLDYIESTGTQIINTNIIQTNKVTIDCHFQVTYEEYNYLYGSQQQSYMMYNGLYNNSQLEYNYKVIDYTPSNDIVMTQRINGNNTEITINNQSFVVNTGSSADYNNIYIFGCNEGARIFNNLIRCYYFKIYNDNELIASFIPSIRKSDSQAGLYDEVSKVFFTNQGTGKFIIGNDSTSTNMIPANFKQIDCVYLNGDSDIDLNVSGDAKYTFDIKFDTTYASRQLMGYDASKANYWGINGSGYYESYNTWGIKAGNRDLIIDEYINGNINRYYNGTLAYTSTYEGTLSYSYHIGTLNGESIYAQYCSIYGIAIEKNGAEIKKYIPVERISDGSTGLYELYSKSFILISNSSNNFTYGEIVGHMLDEGEIIQQANEKQDGEIVYTCKICGAKIHKHINAFAYAVTFDMDEGIDYIKVFDGYDLSQYEVNTIAYTKNKNTNNYSRIDGIVYFEIVLKNGYSINDIESSGTLCQKVADNIYSISMVSYDATITINTREKSNA